jgi:predicted Ser/Thr protein kinase
MTPKKKIKLVGHSGCRLELEDRNGNLVVLKTATDPAYSERLKKQHQKQKNFKVGAFYTPAVFNTHIDENGHFGFSMEYISGLTLAEHFEDAPIATIKAIAEKFLSIVPLSPSFDLSAKSLFTKKIKDLKTKLSPQENESLARAFRMLQAYEWEHCAPSDCHGDMTLENIIYKNL